MRYKKVEKTSIDICNKKFITQNTILDWVG